MGYVLYMMFTNLRDGAQVDRDDIRLFNLFLVSFSVISLILCFWCLRMRTHSIIKLLSVIAAVGIILLSFNLHYKSMHWPYHVRLKLINGSDTLIRDRRLSGCLDINIDSMYATTAKTYELPVVDGCAVWLVNKNDSVKIVEATAAGTGYRKEYIIQK